MANAAQDEQLLLAQVAAGDEEALRQLYLAYRPRLRRYLWHQLDGDMAVVEEALQDVFLAVWRTAEGYRADARVTTWIYQIAHYVALGIRRRMARHPDTLRLEGPDADDASGQGAAAYDACDDSVLNRLALSDALDGLTPKYREALALVFQHGFSLHEAAQILDVPVGTVKSRISYARKALLRALAATPVEETSHEA
ncbi:MAG TPA: RNA polymerase sigma factor [Ktedonobacterales bacterium]|nr:RNA polymerase sigma factor [Ktedonobacterales bacterium]